jgi:hypothetical protein
MPMTSHASDVADSTLRCSRPATILQAFAGANREPIENTSGTGPTGPKEEGRLPVGSQLFPCRFLLGSGKVPEHPFGVSHDSFATVCGSFLLRRSGIRGASIYLCVISLRTN